MFYLTRVFTRLNFVRQYRSLSRLNQTAIFILLSRYFAKIATFISYLIIIRLLGLWGMGILSINLAAINLASQLFGFGLPLVLVRIIPRQKKAGKISSSLIQRPLFVSLSWSLVGIILLAGGLNKILPLIGKSSTTILYPLFLLIPLNILGNFLDRSLQGLGHHFYRIAIRQVILPAVKLIALLIIYLIQGNLSAIISLYLVIAILLPILLWQRLRHYLIFNNLESTNSRQKQNSIQKEIFRLGKLFLPQTMLINTSTGLPLFAAGFFLSGKEAGGLKIILELSLVAASFLFAFGAPFSSLASQRFNEKRIDILRSLYYKIMRRSLEFGSLIFIIYLIFGKLILSAFKLSDFFLPALIILTVFNLIDTAFGPNGLLLQYTNREKNELVILGTSLIVALFLYILLTPKFGVLGISLAFGCQLLIINFWRQKIVRKILFSDQ